MGVLDDMASRLDPRRIERAQRDALTIFGLMVGTLQLARALTDRDLSDQLLARGVDTSLKLLEDPAR
jgi:TetR/AcrR family transcriptional regulator, transcriptional repressor for nem operon